MSVPGTPSTLGWLSENFQTANGGHGLWLDANDQVALELIRRAVPLVAQGNNRMNRDTHQAHFEEVTLAPDFQTKVRNHVELQVCTRLKSRSSLIVLNSTGTPPIDLQGHPTSQPDLGVEAADDLGDLQHTWFLEGGPEELQSIIEAVSRLPDQSKVAIGLEDHLDRQFSAKAASIPHMDADVELNHRGFIYPNQPHVPYSNELGLLYGQANVFGKSEIHRIVLSNEELRLKTLASTMYKRVAEIEEEIKKLDEDQAKAEKWAAVAEQAYNNYNQRQDQAFERRRQLAANRGMASANEPRFRATTTTEAEGSGLGGGKRSRGKDLTPPIHSAKRSKASEGTPKRSLSIKTR